MQKRCHQLAPSVLARSAFCERAIDNAVRLGCRQIVIYARQNYYQWAIVLKENGECPIGSISAVGLNDDLSIVHIGYCLGQRWWHRGIMSEALKAVIDFFFYEVGANRIESRHDPRNPHSGMVMQKCGMKYEGTLRCSDRNNQGICDACWYAILKSER